MATKSRKHREYGESLRSKTIEGFKIAKFGYSLKFGYIDSFLSPAFINEHLEPVAVLDEEVANLFFESEEEATAKKEALLQEAKELVEKYKCIQKDEKAAGEFIKEHYDTKPFHIVSLLWTALAEETKFTFKVVQAIKDM